MIEWIFKHLKIEKSNERDLLKEIFDYFKDNIYSMAAPKVILDVFIHYISSLSRVGGFTSKELWNDKMSNLALELSSLSGLSKQYGQTIFPMFEYISTSTNDVLQAEYRLGANAKPQHIKMSLDVYRSKWINRIQNGFETQNIVLIRGASGQGKSTLAYRYLLDSYPEKDILCIEKILNEENAIEIYAALSGIAENSNTSKIAYIDVSPYDANWLWICEQFCKHGSKLKLLVTIREEDFRRVSIDYNKIKFEEIGLNFAKSEAEEIFKHYPTAHFIKFEDAWISFGESGPLMEFIYLLNQSKNLKDTLESQINFIILNESNADE